MARQNGWLWPKEFESRPTRRRVVYAMMAWSPLLLTSFVGLHSRVFEDPWEFPSANAVQHERVLAYAAVVREVYRWRVHTKGEPPRELARTWIQKASKGELHPLTPAFFEDSSDEGVKGQILSAQRSVVESLLEAAGDNGAPVSLRLDDAALALRLLEITKYSDLRTAYLQAGEQRHALLLVRQLLPKAGRLRSRELLALLEEIRPKREKWADMVRTSQTQFSDFASRMGETPLGHGETGAIRAVAAMSPPDKWPPLQAESNKAAYFTWLKLALRASTGLDRDIEALTPRIRDDGTTAKR